MKKKLRKELKKIKLNFNSEKIIKEPLKILKKIDLKKFQKKTKNSLSKAFENFKRNQKLKKKNKIDIEKKEKIKFLKEEKLELKKKK